MAKVVKRKNSPYWYLKLMVKGKAFFRSSGTSDKRQAEKLLKQTVQDLRVKHKRQELTEEIFEQLTEQKRTILEKRRCDITPINKGEK